MKAKLSRRGALVCGAVFAGSLTWSAAWADQPVALERVALSRVTPGDATTRSGDAVRVSRPNADVVVQGTAGVLFDANFDSLCATTPTTPYATPPGFTVFNVDARTPAGPVSYVNNAWIVREDFANNTADCAMFSTSWYSPAGAANDWATFPAAASPALPITAASVLSWNAIAYDPDYPDGYEVRVSTATNNPSDFLLNPALLTVAAENATWTPRSISLAAFAGQNIRLAFRNTSNDQFLLLVDDVLVRNLFANDPAITAAVPEAFEYSLVPDILGMPAAVDVTVRNNGTAPLTGVVVTSEVSVDGTLADTASSAPTVLAPNATTTVEVGDEPMDEVGEWTFEATVTATEGDQDPANSTISGTITEVVDNGEFRRAEGVAVGSLGIGAGNGGELGTMFELNIDSTLESVRFGINNIDDFPLDGNGDPLGDGVGDFNDVQLEVNVRAWNTVDNEPGAVIATGFVDVPSDAPIEAIQFDVPLTGTLEVPAGKYLVSVIEPVGDNTLTLLTHAERFTLESNWVIWPTSPAGGWAPVEFFGASFENTFDISLFLGGEVLQPVAGDDTFTTNEDVALTDTVATNDVPSTDTTNAYAVTDNVDNGTLNLNTATGAFTYTPNANFNGSDTFTYTLCSTAPAPLCDSATVTITVTAVDDTPVAVADTFSGNEGTVISGNVLANDTAGDGANVVTLGTGTTNGVLVLNADGSFTYTPNANYNGPDSFTYQVCDADNDCATGTVTLTVNAVDSPVTAVDDSFTGQPNTPVTGNVGTNDLVPDGGAVYSVINAPATGVLVLNADGSFTYTPTATQSGPVLFNYNVCDVDNDCDDAVVTIDVLPVRIFANGFE